MNIFQKIAANFIGLKIALAVDKSIRQFPNIDKSVIHTYLSRKGNWSKELYRDIKKRIIDGFDKKVNTYNLDKLGDKYLNFFKEIFPEDDGNEIKEKIKRRQNIKTIGQGERNIKFVVTTSRSKQTEAEIQEQFEYEGKYPKWTSSQDTLGICFNQNRIEPHKNGEIERVHYKTDRYAELFGRGKDCSYFPGYGKIFNRKFKVWYQEFHSDEVRGTVDYYDIGNDKIYPFFADEIANGCEIRNRLKNTRGYLCLFSIRDGKTKLTWYAGLEFLEFTGIVTGPEKE